MLPVSTFDHWFTQQIVSDPRNRARQAQKKGVVLREVPFDDALLQGICDIYNETPIRQGRRFPHYGMDLEKARAYAGTFLDRSIFIGAFLNDQMIGFIKLVTDETQHARVRDPHSVNGAAPRQSADQRVDGAGGPLLRRPEDPHLVYENFTYGKKQGDCLTHFKEVNGFQDESAALLHAVDAAREARAALRTASPRSSITFRNRWWSSFGRSERPGTSASSAWSRSS